MCDQNAKEEVKVPETSHGELVMKTLSEAMKETRR